jgi:hypothetical protein
VEGSTRSILKGIRKGLAYDRSRPCRNPYGDSRSSPRIKNFLKRVFARKDREAILTKRFMAYREN